MAKSGVRSSIEHAAQIAWDKWAATNPNLAEAIEQIDVRDRLIQSIQDDPRFDAASKQYHIDQLHWEFLNRVIEIASPILNSVLLRYMAL